MQQLELKTLHRLQETYHQGWHFKKVNSRAKQFLWAKNWLLLICDESKTVLPDWLLKTFLALFLVFGLNNFYSSLPIKQWSSPNLPIAPYNPER